VATGARVLKNTQAATLDPGGMQQAGSPQDRGGTVLQEPTQVKLGPQLIPPKGAPQGQMAAIFSRPEMQQKTPMDQPVFAESNSNMGTDNQQVLRPIHSIYLPDPETDPAENDITPQDPGKTASGSPSRTFAILARNIWVELRALRPQQPCTIDLNGGVTGAALPANTPMQYFFMLSQKHVVATQISIQNNTGATIYVELSGQAGLGSHAIVTNGLWEPAVKADSISIFTTTGTALLNPQATGGIVLRAWSNPEWSKMAGNL